MPKQLQRPWSGEAPSRTSSDRGLVEACLEGDDRAWAALIDKYKNLIYSIPLKYRASREDAADIFQAVCLDLFRELPRLRNTESLCPWLASVTAHKAFHFGRQRRARGEAQGMEAAGLPASVVLPPALAFEVERDQLVREAIARLPGRCQELIRMLFYEQPARPYAEVARRLGLAIGSIGFIRGRCLKRLHQSLKELGI